jgi:hypothetical protein
MPRRLTNTCCAPGHIKCSAAGDLASSCLRSFSPACCHVSPRAQMWAVGRHCVGEEFTRPKRLRFVALGFALGLAFAVLAAWVLWQIAFPAIYMTERPVVLATAAGALFSHGPAGETVYIREGKGWDVQALLSQLAIQHPELKVLPWAQRPADPECEMGRRCGADDYLYVEIEAQPYERMAVVRYATLACGGDMILVRIFSKWRVLTKKLWCT